MSINPISNTYPVYSHTPHIRESILPDSDPSKISNLFLLIVFTPIKSFRVFHRFFQTTAKPTLEWVITVSFYIHSESWFIFILLRFAGILSTETIRSWTTEQMLYRPTTKKKLRKMELILTLHNSWRLYRTIYIVQCYGYLITSEHRLYNVTSQKTPVRLLIPLLQSQPHVTIITHKYFLRCYSFTQL
jgi:hypothetical protein